MEAPPQCSDCSQYFAESRSDTFSSFNSHFREKGLCRPQLSVGFSTFHAALLMSDTIAVVTSAVINLRIIAESLNPQKNTTVAKASHFSVHGFAGLSHRFVSCCKHEITDTSCSRLRWENGIWFDGSSRRVTGMRCRLHWEASWWTDSLSGLFLSLDES